MVRIHVDDQGDHLVAAMFVQALYDDGEGEEYMLMNRSWVDVEGGCDSLDAVLVKVPQKLDGDGEAEDAA